jgi:hypothetical protein
MLKKLLILPLIALALFSCKKENAGGPDHLTAKFNGTEVDFSDALAAEKYLDPSNGYTLSVLGMGGTTNDPLPSFDLMIHDDSEISTKTYNRPTDAVSSTYTDTNLDNYNAGDQFTITISSITDTEVRGTFSGKMIKSGSGEVVDVTEGSFRAKIY